MILNLLKNHFEVYNYLNFSCFKALKSLLDRECRSGTGSELAQCGARIRNIFMRIRPTALYSSYMNGEQPHHQSFLLHDPWPS